MPAAKIHTFPKDGSLDIESMAWPKRGAKSGWDEQGDYVQEEIKQVINSITDESNGKYLTNPQAFQLLKLFRVSAAASKNGVKWRSMGQLTELVGAMCSAAVPVLVGLQTQFDKETQPVLYWVVNLSSISLSLIATLAVAIERTRGMKEQGVIERLEGADINLELKKFMAGSKPYGPDYRKNFPRLSAKVAEIQHKGTTDLYSAFASNSADKTSEMGAGPPPRVDETPAESEATGAGKKAGGFMASMKQGFEDQLESGMVAVKSRVVDEVDSVLDEVRTPKEGPAP